MGKAVAEDMAKWTEEHFQSLRAFSIQRDPQGMHTSTHVHSRVGARSHVFSLVPLATCGAFPVSMVIASKEFRMRREVEINTTEIWSDQGLCL